MRPNTGISHILNGRVKDYAEQQGMSFEEAYRESIEALSRWNYADES